MTKNEQASARVAAAAGRLLKPSKVRRKALAWLEDIAMEQPGYVAPPTRVDARVLLAILADGVTVAGSALTQTPDRKGKHDSHAVGDLYSADDD